MKKCILKIAATLDGFIASKDNSRDWSLKAVEIDNDFESFYDSIDTIVMGRKTFDEVKERTPEVFKEKNVFVITHYLRQQDKNVTFIHENIPQEIRKMKKGKGGNIWIMGGAQLVNILIKENLIDEAIITTIPEILGEGIRLFADDNPSCELKLIDVKDKKGLIQAHYKVK